MQPGPFNAFLAKVCAVDEKTVTVYTREMKEAGLMTSGGRGRYAPHMRPIDAARVLIALMATDRPSEAVESVTRWRAMQLRPDLSEGALPEYLAGEPTLEQALVRILAVDPDPALWPQAWPAFQVARNEKTAMLEWGLNEAPRAVFREEPPTFTEPGIRRSCLLAPYQIMKIAAEMWVDRLQGCDVQGQPLELDHPWNLEGTADERRARVRAIYDYVRTRDADWQVGAD